MQLFITFNALWWTFTNKSWSALSELISWLISWAPPCKQQLSSIICSGGFLFLGRKGRLADDCFEFCHIKIQLLCTWIFFPVCDVWWVQGFWFFFLCYHFLHSSTWVVLFNVPWSREDSSFDLYIVKRWQSSICTLLGSKGSSIAAVFLVLSSTKILIGELLITNPYVWDHSKSV